METPPFAEIVPGGVMIRAWIVPGASRSEITGTHGDSLRLRVSAPPERGSANREAERLLSKAVAGPVRLISGMTSRRKVFLASGDDPYAIVLALSRLEGRPC